MTDVEPGYSSEGLLHSEAGSSCSRPFVGVANFGHEHRVTIVSWRLVTHAWSAAGLVGSREAIRITLAETQIRKALRADSFCGGPLVVLTIFKLFEWLFKIVQKNNIEIS